MKKAGLLVLLCTTVLTAVAWHPYSVTIAHADLQEDRIVLTIRTNAEDLLYFHRLPVDTMFNLTAADLTAAARQHATTLLSGLFILDENQDRLRAEIAAMNYASVGPQGSINVMNLMKYPLSYTLEFMLTPETTLLQFHQQLSEKGVPAVTLLTVSKGGKAVVENVELSKEKPFRIGRHVTNVTLPENSGFMLSYITLSDTHIMHELTIPVTVLKSFFVSDQTSGDSLRERMQTFIDANSAVTINNQKIKPEVTMVVLQNSGHEAYGPALAAVRVEYKLTKVPADISIMWNTYNWQMRWFESLIDDFGKKVEHNFSRFTPEYITKRKLTLKEKD